LVATFTDEDPVANPASNYSASIDWGDSSGSCTGTVASDGHGGFQVFGDHTFTLANIYDAVVTVTDRVSQAIIHAAARVAVPYPVVDNGPLINGLTGVADPTMTVAGHSTITVPLGGKALGTFSLKDAAGNIVHAAMTVGADAPANNGIGDFTIDMMTVGAGSGNFIVDATNPA
jgi:hypothetical protein